MSSAQMFSVSDGTLATISSHLIKASDVIDDLAAAALTVPSAGVADVMIADLLSHLLLGASGLAIDAQEAAGRVVSSSWMYAGMDACVADSLPRG